MTIGSYQLKMYVTLFLSIFRSFGQLQLARLLSHSVCHYRRQLHTSVLELKFLHIYHVICSNARSLGTSCCLSRGKHRSHAFRLCSAHPCSNLPYCLKRSQYLTWNRFQTCRGRGNHCHTTEIQYHVFNFFHWLIHNRYNLPSGSLRNS